MLLDGLRMITYTRVSTEEQKRHGHSLELQPERVGRWVEAMGGTVVAVVQDNVSAGKPFDRRDGGREVLRLLDAGEADGMVVTRFDRAFRVTIDGLLAVQKQFISKGRTVVAVEQPVDIHTPFGWKQFINMVADAEYERALIGMRARETTEELRRAGKLYGHVPFGCVEVGGALYRHPVDWEVREKIVLAAEQHCSSRTIAQALDDDGTPAPGRKQKGGGVAGGKRWHHTTVINILNNHDDLKHIGPLPDALEPMDSEVCCEH